MAAGGGEGRSPGHVFVVVGDPNMIAADVLIPTKDDLEDVLTEFIKAEQEIERFQEALASLDKSDPQRHSIEGKILNLSPKHSRGSRLVVMPLVSAMSHLDSASTPKEISELLQFLFAWSEGSRWEKDAPKLVIDVVLVCPSPDIFGAVHAIRKRVIPDDVCWRVLNFSATEAWYRELKEKACMLGEIAKQDQLAIFLGAGVSYGAGLPLWKELLQEMAFKAGLNDSEQVALGKMDFLDAANILERRLEARGHGLLGHLVADRMRSEFYSLQQALIAGMPVNEFITTNYDDLFEKARRSSGNELTVIPGNRMRSSSGWILKMHGDVSFPEDIVLSRSHYLNYDDSRGPLAALVQVMLATQVMLFVGFSMTDYNFHKIVSAVQSGFLQKKRQIGYALMLKEDRLNAELWQHDIQVVPMHSVQCRGLAARKLETFLDLVAASSASSGSFICQNGFASYLQDPEISLGNLIQELNSASSTIKNSSSFLPVLRFLDLFSCNVMKEAKEDFIRELSPPFGRMGNSSWAGIGEETEQHDDYAEESYRRAESSGHVFVIRGDISMLACDAWLIPTSGFTFIPSQFLLPYEQMKHYGQRSFEIHCKRRRPQNKLEELAFPKDKNPEILGFSDFPDDRGVPFMSKGVAHASLEELLECIKVFIYISVDEVIHQRKLSPKFHRSKHLFALPVLGTGLGGFRYHTGKVVWSVLKLLDVASEAHGIDLCLVCFDDETYTVAQAIRLHLFKDPWPSLNSELKEQLKFLSEACRGNNLVLHISEAFSVPGFPCSRKLICQIAKQLKITENELKMLLNFSTDEQIS
jgi:hypothetical protein